VGISGVLYIYILTHVDPLLGKDREKINEATAVARQKPARINGSNVGSGVFYVDRSEDIQHDRPSSVKLVQAVRGSEEFVGELVN
jgi:hypothetical protein